MQLKTLIILGLEALESAQNSQMTRRHGKSADKILKSEPANSLLETLDESAALNAKLNNPHRKMLLNRLRFIDKNETYKINEEFALAWKDKYQ